MSDLRQAAIRELAERIDRADAIVIGGGSGLSSAAGYDHYHWSPALSEALAPFREHYGFSSPLAGFYHCFSSYEEQWWYYSQYIRFMWDAPTGPTYLDLRALVADKPTFVLTTNVDRQFFRVFPPEQICAFQGDFGYCQYSQPCRDDIWENREMVEELTDRLEGVHLPNEAVPRCPDCGRVLAPWVRDDTFLEGRAWKAQVDRYHAFLRRWLLEEAGKNVLLLELGVGEMTPSVIKLPFWELAARNENVFYACLNREVAHARNTCGGGACICKGTWRSSCQPSCGGVSLHKFNWKECASMADYNLIAEKFKEADAILIAASNGLSISEGLHLFADNAAFAKLFGDFKRKYGLRCILQGMMAEWPSEEEKWAFWARLIHHYCGKYRPTPVMKDLKAIVGVKDYFIVTSNGEQHFELCGFEPRKIYEIEGNWLTMPATSSQTTVLASPHSMSLIA